MTIVFAQTKFISTFFCYINQISVCTLLRKVKLCLVGHAMHMPYTTINAHNQSEGRVPN